MYTFGCERRIVCAKVLKIVFGVELELEIGLGPVMIKVS